MRAHDHRFNTPFPTHEDLFENTKRKVTDYQNLIALTITILRQFIEILWQQDPPTPLRRAYPLGESIC